MNSILSQLGQPQLGQLPPGGPPQAPGQPLSALLGGDADEGPSDGGLSTLQDVLNDFPPLLAALTNPQDVDMAVQAMRLLTTVQKNLMSGASGGSPAQGR